MSSSYSQSKKKPSVSLHRRRSSCPDGGCSGVGIADVVVQKITKI